LGELRLRVIHIAAVEHSRDLANAFPDLRKVSVNEKPLLPRMLPGVQLFFLRVQEIRRARLSRRAHDKLYNIVRYKVITQRSKVARATHPRIRVIVIPYGDVVDALPTR
jgi:hypothetical protein